MVYDTGWKVKRSLGIKSPRLNFELYVRMAVSFHSSSGFSPGPVYLYVQKGELNRIHSFQITVNENAIGLYKIKALIILLSKGMVILNCLY